MKPFLKVLAVVNLFASSSGSFTYLRYDQTNFEELNKGEYKVLAYKDIDAHYQVSVPPGGEDSGGTFLLDTVSYACLKPIFVDLESSLTLRLSFWCDVVASELKIITGCNYYSEETLCENNAYPERNGKWNQTVWTESCLPGSNVSTFGNIKSGCVSVSTSVRISV